MTNQEKLYNIIDNSREVGVVRKFLKERKTNGRKSYLPPAPLILKKEYKEKTDKISLSGACEKNVEGSESCEKVRRFLAFHNIFY